MGLIDILPEFNLYEEYWRIYTNGKSLPPQYYGSRSDIERSIIGDGSEIYGRVYRSVIGSDVIIGEGAEVHDSIIMNGARIEPDCRLTKVIVAEDAHIGARVHIGEGPEAANETEPAIYTDGLSVIGGEAEIPAGVIIGKNVMVNGITSYADYPEGILESGRTLDRGGSGL